MINERISALRNLMEQNKINAYVIPTSDEHGSEYLSDHFKTREYMSGFTGSAGTLVVTMYEALLWTDGRYFIQAAEQLQDSEIKLMKAGEEGVPSVEEYLKKNLIEGSVIGFDGQTTNARQAEKLAEISKMKIKSDVDLGGEIWSDRPAIEFKPIWRLMDRYAGVSYPEKVANIRKRMEEEKADTLLLTSLDEIAWVTNIRGDDIEYNPVCFSYMVITKYDSLLFANTKSFDEKTIYRLSEEGVKIKEYDEIYDYVKVIPEYTTLWLDKTTTNYSILRSIKPEVKIIDKFSPALHLKAIKNNVEIENMINAHIMDGVAVTRFIYWLKHNVSKEKMTEISIANKLEEFRKSWKTYLAPSFETIVGYADHGAIVHYSATKETDYEVKADNFVLIDSGGHYVEGTTDITRTIALGNISTEQKKMYTAVLRGNLKLANAKFLSGCTGVSLDYVARQPLWEIGYDYRHGTGHGVGYLLNVHEQPNAFRYMLRENVEENAEFKPGMITSDEPGVYLEGQYGIRLENLLLCVEKQVTEYGQFLGFDTLTLVPFDVDAIDVNIMSDYEIRLLRQYHKLVYKKISPYLNIEEQEWLYEVCMEI